MITTTRLVDGRADSAILTIHQLFALQKKSQKGDIWESGRPFNEFPLLTYFDNALCAVGVDKKGRFNLVGLVTERCYLSKRMAGHPCKDWLTPTSFDERSVQPQQFDF